MRKLIVFNMTTLDGFFEGPNNEIDWHNVDDEFNEFAIEQLKSADTLIFGRKTYELMAGYWPAKEAMADDPVVAELMNSLPKTVFSSTMKEAGWNNTTLIKANVSEEINKLKQGDGKDLLILGSGKLASHLLNKGLIDEIRLIINPVILGKGVALFNGFNGKISLKLIRSKTFRSGNLLCCYDPEK